MSILKSEALKRNPLAIGSELAKRNFTHYAKQVFPNLILEPFHRSYYEILDAFARGRIKKLIVTMPPQHGKSQGTSVFLPSYILGLMPDTKVAVASYNTSFARKFSRLTQRLMDSEPYHRIFPETQLSGKNVVTISSNYLRNANEFEVVNRLGGMKSIGKGGALTGNQVDIMIMDDLFKDYGEAKSPVARASTWDWYVTVVKTRLHNDSQELMTFTRWHEEDPIGKMEDEQEVVTINSIDEIEDIPRGAWVKVNFQAIKEDEPTEIDARAKGVALWENRHSLEGLIEKKNLDPDKFECLYQGNPKSAEGMLYGTFRQWTELPSVIVHYGNYTDTADKGDDYLCSINYVIDNQNFVYVIDLLFTQEGMEQTEPKTAALIARGRVKKSYIESNNGGSGFARSVRSHLKKLDSDCIVVDFHQSGNKEARILSNATQVNNIIMPEKWHIKHPEFYKAVSKFKKLFAANKYDDAPDVLTGIHEKHFSKPKSRGLKIRGTHYLR
jgi:predicted phage terminase large subunit-like protein